MKSRRHVTVVAAAIVATVLAACGALEEPLVVVDLTTPPPAPASPPPAATESPSQVESPAPTPPPTPSPADPAQSVDSPSVPENQEDTPPPADPDEPESDTTPTLTRGDKGEAVATLQARLVELGYWLGVEDGSFGLLTEQAVLAFQGWEGLPRDGVVGQATWAALRDAQRPEPHASGGDLVEVHTDAQVLLVVRDGATRWAFHVSTGTNAPYRLPNGREAIADTPAGTWKITWQVNGWRDGELGLMYRPKYFHKDGIAIHGYHSVPPHPASHGCVRVTLPAMDVIWDQDLAPQGSTVVVL